MQTSLQRRHVYESAPTRRRRIARLHSRDGLSELSHALTLTGAALCAAFHATWPAMLALFALSYLLRALENRVRGEIGPQRGGFATFPYPGPAVIACFAALPLTAALAARAGLLPAGALIAVLAGYLGGIQVLKGRCLAIPRFTAMGAVSIALGAGLALSGWGFLFNFVIWAASQAAINATVGAWLLWNYLR